MNLENPILQDIRVREAISRAIDKTQITKNFFKNKLAPAEGILPPQHPAYKKITPLFSKQKAKQILEGAGWKKNSQGVLEKDGKALSLVYKTSAGIKVLENIQVYICDQLKDVGIQCLIKNEPPRTLLSETVSHGDFDLIMFGQEIPPDTSLNSFFASTEIPTAKNNWTGGNVIRAHYPKLDVLLKKFDDEHIPMKRSKLASQIEEFLRNEFAMIPLYHRREAMVFPKSLSGVKDSFGGTSFETPETWIIK